MNTNSCLISVTHSGNKHKTFTASTGDDDDDDIYLLLNFGQNHS